MSFENIEVFQGGTVVFEVIGGRFELYKALVARKSQRLAAKVENNIRPSGGGVVPLDDTDAATFARFVEFLITGDYNAAKPLKPSEEDPISDETNSDELELLTPDDDEVAEVTLCSSDQEVPVAIAAEPEVDEYDPVWASLTTKKQKGKNLSNKKSRKYLSWEDDWGFDVKPTSSTPKSLSLAGPTTEVDVFSPMPTCSTLVPNGDGTLNYLPVFMSHAQLYVFANTYGVPDLQKLAARRLDEALSMFQFASPCNTEFCTLLEYSDRQTATRKKKSDTLRTIMINSAARNMESLIESKRFLKMVRKGGDVVRDLTIKTVSRLGG